MWKVYISIKNDRGDIIKQSESAPLPNQRILNLYKQLVAKANARETIQRDK